MQKILIVDDEVLERKALTKIINSSFEEVTVVGEAQNGRKAIEMAKALQPDIIFMDIKMPGIDGVKAVKEIKKMDPAIRFIMVSAFNTFEYAKEVMQQGVKEYILKPGSKKDILESLERVLEDLREERKEKEEQKSLRESLSRAVTIAQKELVSSLLMNQVQDIHFEEWGQLLGVEITSGYIMLFTLHSKKGAELSSDAKNAWYKWLKQNLKSVVKKQEVMIGPMTDTQVPVLFLCKKEAENSHFRTNILTVIESLNNLFPQKAFKAEIRIGIGNRYHNAHELNKSYHESIRALQELLKVPDRKYLFSDKHGHTEMPSVSGLFEVEKKLLDAIRQGNVNEVLYIFDSFLARHSENRHIKAAVIKKTFDELFILVSRMLHELGVSYEKSFAFDDSEDGMTLIQKGKEHLIAVVQHVQYWRNHHAKGLLLKAKEYIEHHYADSLTLELAAEHVELSPYYFSKLFKDRFGMTFIDYLTEIRIERAKEEMSDQRKSLKEICYSVGYRDPNYFSRVFKKHTGLSPSEFRKSALSQI